MRALIQQPVRPLPDSPADADRWEYTAKARRILYGQWSDDLRRRLTEEIGTTRAAVVKFADVSHNLLLSICDSLAQSYVRPPIITNAEPADALLGAGGALDQSGYFALMSRVERDLYALREILICVTVSPDGVLNLRPVTPDNVIAHADPRTGRPNEIAEMRLRMIDDQPVWAYDVYSIRDPEVPVFRVVGANGDHKGKDITFEVAGTPPLAGPAYPYRDSEGAAVLPYCFYHAQKTARLFDAYALSDLVDGTMSLGVMYSYLRHVMRSASWPQRCSVGLEPAGMSTQQDGRLREIITDPASLLQLTTSDGFEGQGFLYQFNAGADTGDLMTTIAQYERGLVAAAGVPAADFQRVGGDPRSGYALSITREGLREMQRRVQPQLMGDGHNGDTGLMRLCAIMLNRHAEAVGEPLNLPETGYAVEYQGIPETLAELEQKRKNVLELMGAGLMSRVAAYQELNPGTSAAEATAALAAIDGMDPAAVDVDAAPDAPETEAPQTETPEAEAMPTDAEAAALNGAQVTAAQGIVSAVAVGDLPRASGVSMLVEFFGIEPDAADRIMGDVGRGFEPASIEREQQQEQ